MSVLMIMMMMMLMMTIVWLMTVSQQEDKARRIKADLDVG